MNNTTRLWSLVFLLTTIPISPFANAETRALLVGVSSYPSLPVKLHLQGPRNDVRLMQSSLARQGIPEQNIEILADGIAGRELPTRKSIFQKLEKLQSISRAGDWVVLYFSGHGSQQPQQDRRGWPERDGRDEIFLPYDTGRWDGSVGSVRNAIVDDEIGRVLQKFSRAGVSVWVIFDTCHAGDMSKGVVRAVSTAIRWRTVSPQALGIPDASDVVRVADPGSNKSLAAPSHRRSVTAPATREKTPFVGAGASAGQVIAFYSSQFDEPSPEEHMPGAEGKMVNGVFTWYLAKALDHGRSRQFDGLLQSVLRNYRDDRRAFPTPYADGQVHLPLPFGMNGQ